MKITKGKLKGIGAGLICAFALSFLVSVYAPLELFLADQNEFWFSLSDLIYPIIMLFFVIFFAISAVLIVLRLIGKLPYYIGLLVSFAALLISYINGNFLVSNLPPLDGTSVEWSAHIAERIKSYGVIVAVIVVLTFILIKFKKTIFKKTVLFGSLALTLLLTFTLSTLLLTTKIEDKKGDLTVTGYNTFEYSTDTNLIVICVDALDSKHFLEVLEKNPEFSDVFDDFTYYDNALAGYPFTRNSLAMMYSGEWYENKTSFKEYCDESISNAPITQKLQKDNYKIGMYSNEIVLGSEKCDGIFENHFSLSPMFDSINNAQKLITKMASIRYAPWDLKHYGYDVSEYSQTVKTVSEIKDDTAIYYANIDFYNAVKSSNPITLTDKKCARFIHIEGSHVPFVYDKDVNIIADGDYHQNIEASITICNQFLQRLKESGVYENSAIVILGDHGFQTEDMENNDLTIRMNPALMIKGIGDSAQQMQINSTPVSYIDLSQTYVNLLEKVSTDKLFSEFKYEDGRRFFEYYYLSEHHLIEYFAYGDAYDLDKFEPSGKTYDLEE